MAKKQKRVIVAPLAWGLGHATRCIPVVRELLKMNCAVWAVLTTEQKALYEKEFGKRIQYIPFEEPRVDYRHSFAMAMVRQLPQLSAQIKRESSLADWLSTKLQPDLIISDNRYGFYSSNTPSVIISHQLQIRAGLLSGVVNSFLYPFLKRFDSIWVPDTEGEPNLSGKLSHGKRPEQTISYPGPLSRLSTTSSADIRYDWLALLSGPEPERSKLEDLLTEAAINLDLKMVLLAGQPESGSAPQTAGKITRYPHVDDRTLMKLAAESAGIVCRSGYSTLCDLWAMKRKALLIPTPGQTEQLYLAKHFTSKFGFRTVSQRNINGLLRELKNPQPYTERFEVELSNHWKGLLQKVLGN